MGTDIISKAVKNKHCNPCSEIGLRFLKKACAVVIQLNALTKSENGKEAVKLKQTAYTLKGLIKYHVLL